MGKDNLVHYYADKVLSGNQHVVLTVLGGAGSGKSMWAGGLIIGLANYMGKRLKRDPRTLFNFTDNLACINLDRVQAIMNDPQEYNILWLDDIAVALNSRTFYKASNIDFNDILQTFRPNKNIVILTTQYSFLLDKVPRTLSHYQVEMTHKIFETHNLPLNASKVCEVQYKHRTNETWYPFLQDETGRYVQYVSYKAPDVFQQEYDRIRNLEFKRMLELKKQIREDREREKEPKEKQPSIKERILELRRDWNANVDDCQNKYPSKKGIPQTYWIAKGINPQTARGIS